MFLVNALLLCNSSQLELRFLYRYFAPRWKLIYNTNKETIIEYVWQGNDTSYYFVAVYFKKDSKTYSTDLVLHSRPPPKKKNTWTSFSRWREPVTILRGSFSQGVEDENKSIDSASYVC